VAAKEVLNTVGSFVPSVTIILSLPSKLNRSKVYLLAFVLPVSLSVQLSDTASSTACAAADVELVARVTPVKVVLVLPVYVNISELICNVPLKLFQC
jgi:hypothetical protein